MQIHPCSPSSAISAEDAATKIQAGFRGYRVRKQLKENAHKSHTIMDGNSVNRNGTATKENNENIQNNNNIVVNGKRECQTNDDTIHDILIINEEKCATKIQASVRGYLVRKKQKMASNAATKIQAGFRGFRARKELKKLKA